jgi:translocation and assembly module TamB
MRKRLLPILALAIGGVLATCVLIIVGALIVVNTGWGNRRLLERVLPAIDDAIAGRLTLDRLRVGIDRLILLGVRLRGPEGMPVAEVDRVVVVFSPLALLRRRVDLQILSIERPQLWLVQDERGLNLARALAPTGPAEVGEKNPTRLVITVRQLTLGGGRVELQTAHRASERSGRDAPLRITDLSAQGSATYDLATGHAQVRLGLSGRSRSIYVAPLRLVLEAGVGPAGARADLALSLGANRFEGELHAVPAGSESQQTLTLTLRKLHLAPGLLPALWPAWPVAGPVDGRGRLRRRGQVVEAELALATAAGKIEIDGGLDVASWRSPGIRIRGEGLDLGALLSRAPASNLAFTLEARGGGGDLARLDGEVRLQVMSGQIGGRPAGPLRLHLRARNGNYHLDELFAALPGLSLSARGQADLRKVDVTAELRVADLRRTAQALAAGRSLPLAGQGHLSARLEGSWQAPSLTAGGRFSRLDYAGNQSRALALRVRAPDLRRPQLTDASLAVRSLAIGSERLEQIEVALRTTPGRNFRTSLQVRGPQPLTLAASGRWSETLDALHLTRLELAYPEATWKVRRPARIEVGDRLLVDGLVLVSGTQRIALDVLRSGAKLRARARLDSLDLSRLPRLIRAAVPALAGRLDATVEAQGSVDRPDLHIRAALRDGRVALLRPVDLNIDLRSAGGRLAGELQAQALGGAIRSRFDLQATFPPTRSSPLELAVEAESIRLDRLAAVLGGEGARIGGTAVLKLQLGGTAAAPRMKVDARVEDLVAAGRPIGQLRLSLASRPGSSLTAELQLESLGRTGTAHVSSPLDVGRLLLRPAVVQLRDLPFRATARFDEVPIEPLARLSGIRGALEGTASLLLDARGTVANPVGSLEVILAGVQASGIPSTDARLVLQSVDGAAGLSADLSVSRNRQMLARARASLALAVTRIADRVALARAPVTLEATLLPIDLQRLVAPVESDRQRPRRLGGRLQARARLEGTLGDPRIEFDARAENVVLEGAPLGQGRLRLDYRAGRPQLELELAGPGGGSLVLTAASQLDLGYPLPAGGVALRRLPITARLDAEYYDLTPLSCLSDEVRVVAGKLSAQAKVDGHLGAPGLEGRLEWRDGRLVLAGLGEFRDIHLLLHGDENRIVLHELAARSGAGTARLSATAERLAGGQLELAARADLRRFPIRSDGRRIATLTMAPRLTGRASLERIALTAEIDETDLRLASRTGQEVQSLERPADVVRFWGDEPLNREQADKHAALAQARRDLLAGEDPVASEAASSAVQARTAGPPPAEVLVKAPNNIWVRGQDVNLELGLGPEFVIVLPRNPERVPDLPRGNSSGEAAFVPTRVARPEPSIFGTVFVRRGQVEVLGRRFRLQDGSVLRFTGPPDRPVLDVRAVHEPRHADLTVMVNLSGPVDALAVEITSPERPEYAQADLLAVILTGRPPGESADVSPEATSRAASLLGGFLADRLQSTLMRRLPIDVLSLDPGEGLRALELEAGTYLGEDLYVAYVGRFGSDPFLRENENEVQLEYRLSQRWSFQGSFGDARRGSAELVWTRRY